MAILVVAVVVSLVVAAGIILVAAMSLPGDEPGAVVFLGVLLLASGFIAGSAATQLSIFPDEDGIVEMRGRKFKCIEVVEKRAYEPKERENKP